MIDRLSSGLPRLDAVLGGGVPSDAITLIAGEPGTTGRGIRARLAALPEMALTSLPAAQRKDKGARREMMAAVDLVILCLPDDAAREAAALADGLGPAAPKLLDASTAHRVDPRWVYGFPEMAPDQADRIAAVAADFLLNLIAYNLIRIPKLVAA